MLFRSNISGTKNKFHQISHGNPYSRQLPLLCVYMCPRCYQRGGSLLHCLSTLTLAMNPTDQSARLIANAVYFCCTGLGVTSTGRYPASCPAKPGLSSPDTFRIRQLRPFILLTGSILTHNIQIRQILVEKSSHTSKQLPPTNSRKMELFGIASLGTPTK